MTTATAERRSRASETTAVSIPVVAYYRMSTAQQDTSIDQQRREVEKYATARGFRIIREYIDEAISGDNTEKRVQFLKMLSDAADGKFEKVVCWDQERFGRFDSLEAGKWLSPMLDSEVGLTTVSQGDIDFETFAGRLVYTVNQEGKNAFLKTLSDNVCRKFHQMASDGLVPSGVAAYGYDRAYIDAQGNEVARARRTEESPVKLRRTTVRLVPGDPEEVRWVKWLFETYANQDVGMTYLRDHLNAHNVPTPRYGKHWTIPSIHKMLSNERYCGDLTYGRVRAGRHNYVTKSRGVVKILGKKNKGKCIKNEVADHIIVRGTHEALIDRVTFDRVQRKRETNKIRTTPGKSRETYLLAGLLICKRCGCRMTGRRKGDRVMYQCDNYVRYGTVGGCRLWSVNQDVFIEFIVGIVQSIVSDPKQFQALRSAVERKLTERAAVDPKLIESKRVDLKRLEREYETGKERALTAPDDLRADLFATLRTMKDRETRLKREIDDLKIVDATGSIQQQVKDTLACFEEFVSDHRKAPPARLSMLIRRIVQRVELSFRVRPGTEDLKRQTFEISEGVLLLECPLPVALFNGSSDWLSCEDGALSFNGRVLNGGHRHFSGENGILRANERLPNDIEAKRMAREMSPELERIFRLSRLLSVRCIHLSKLLIEDVDLRGKTVTLDGSPVALSAGAAAVIESAIGKRRSGVVFCTPRGRAWNFERLKKSLNRVKTVAGIQGKGERVLI